MNAPRYLILALLLSGCGAPQDSKQNDYSQQQRLSLSNVFYHGNPPPKQPATDELKEIQDKVRAAKPWERAPLEELYPDDPELWVYATRDSDGDGQLDFWVSDYYGRFLSSVELKALAAAFQTGTVFSE